MGRSSIINTRLVKTKVISMEALSEARAKQKS